MFFEKLKKLCNKKGISISELATNLGYTTAAASGWKRGAQPRPSVIKTIADYFDVDVGYFYDDAPAIAIQQPIDDEFNKLELAMYGDLKDLTDDDKRQILDFAHYLKTRKK